MRNRAGENGLFSLSLVGLVSGSKRRALAGLCARRRSGLAGLCSCCERQTYEQLRRRGYAPLKLNAEFGRDEILARAGGCRGKEGPRLRPAIQTDLQKAMYAGGSRCVGQTMQAYLPMGRITAWFQASSQARLGDTIPAAPVHYIIWQGAGAGSRGDSRRGRRRARQPDVRSWRWGRRGASA